MNYNLQGGTAAMAGEDRCTPYDEKQAYLSRTIGQNIDARIAMFRGEIERLQGVRAQLESGASLLDVRIEDLRQAMNY